LSSSVNGTVSSVRKQKEQYIIHQLSFYLQTFNATLYFFLLGILIKLKYIISDLKMYCVGHEYMF